MQRTQQLMASYRAMLADCGTTEAKLRGLRDYARRNIPGVWHYPDDCERCLYCHISGRDAYHVPQIGVRGYLGTGSFAIVSDTPSGDVHFRSKQAGLYYSKLRKHGLENSFQADAFNTSNSDRDADVQRAIFLIQMELVRPKAMLVMDMCSRLRKRTGGWLYSGPLQTIEQHFQADGFAFTVDPGFQLKAAVATCEPPTGTPFSIDVYRIYHYTKLTDSRRRSSPEDDWERHFENVLSAARSVCCTTED